MGCIRFQRLFGLGGSLGLVESIRAESDIGEDDDGDVVVFGVPLTQVPPARPVACNHPAMEVKGAATVSFDSRSGCLLGLDAVSCCESARHDISVTLLFGFVTFVWLRTKYGNAVMVNQMR